MKPISKKGDYAIRGMVYLAGKPPDRVALVSEIARAMDIPPMFLAKIFQQFTKLGLVRSFRGSGGGFLLGRSPEDITLYEIVEAVEGPILPNRCVLSDGACNREKACTVHPVWKKVEKSIVDILSGVTLKDLAKTM
jgi:Rrf2 family transcriptional regulator, iron-sulfur cluster assembly transcription factor